MRTAFAHFATSLGATAAQLRALESTHSPAQNIQVLQDFYHAIARSDYAALGALLTDDVHFEIHGLPGVPATPLIGREKVLPAFQASFEAIAPTQSTVESLVTQADKLILIATDHGSYVGTKTPYAFRFLLELTFRGAQMHKIREWVLPLE
jgi:ketosteroid isomerase-like protein